MPYQWVECSIESRQGDTAEVVIASTYCGSASYRVAVKDLAIVTDEHGQTKTVVACRRPRLIEKLVAVQAPGPRCLRQPQPACNKKPTILLAPNAIFKPSGKQDLLPLPT